MTDRYKSRASTSADGCGKWYIVDVVVSEKILVEISNDEDEHDAKEIALGESRLFRQTELEVQVDIEPAPAAPECLEREMRYAHLVIPRWDGGESRGTQQERGHGHYECAVGKVERLQAEVEQLRRWAETSWNRGFQQGLQCNRLMAVQATDALKKEREAHAETNRAMTEALLVMEEREQRDEALLRQALEGIELHLRHHERGCVFLDEIALALRERLAETANDLTRCPNCGGPADNGHDREVPPNPYWCSKCTES
ncbi:hypothetical protein LCC91_07900 [Tepidimonas taiwanensis]|uniref:Uncharacterized protein n=1 Tax=Tepidimonas taiwanensis TaxID=307486 RepID=A0A554XAX1_9BURK|nr:hypothetical protein [Tepidimonas taiwanensis]TSE32968.1 hypothetical protein Ttaiw_00829 [Tepidimonas taiwanensis]UBQ04498.1 hypothetical protein LCC91_07900 [Tepidimonas taiwanensis]